MKPPVLLIDADVLVYQAAAGAEKIIVWEEDTAMPVCSLVDAQAAFYDKLFGLLNRFNTTDYILAFSDAIEVNFRRKLYDPYKRNREGKPRPVALKSLRQVVIESEDPTRVYERSCLEADDCLGILATHKAFKSDRQKIVVSIDKDLKSIPGLFFNIGHPEEGVQTISNEDADRWHMTQTLIGDAADGYPGCPGIGPKKAEKMLAEGGLTTVAEMWPVVVEAYEKAGLSEAAALTQARVARILRAEDYNFKFKEVKLWKPVK